MIMNEIDDNKLMAFVDGCLSEAEAAEVREIVANDPVLLAEVTRLQKTRQAVSSAVDELANTPMPEAVMDMLRTPGESVSAPTKHSSLRWLQPFAVAALLGVAFFTGSLLQETGFSDSYLPQNTVHALNTAPDDTQSSNLTIQASYLDPNGSFCRTFTAADGSLNGLACRKELEWQLVALINISSSGYIPAGGSSAALLSAYTDQMLELEDGLEQEYLITP